MTKTLIQRILALLTALLVIAAISLRRDGRLLGHDIHFASKGAADTTRLEIRNGTIIVNTSELSKDILGYAGPLPLKVFVTEGRIDSIAVLENSETPGFLRHATKVLLPQYIGKTVDEARAAEVDAVSGCTFSSSALIANMDLALAQIPGSHSDLLKGTKHDPAAIAKLIIAFIVALMAAILPLFVKNKTYRMVQMVLNVAVLGFYSATFLSYSSLVGAMSNGLGIMNLTLALLLVLAFIYPLFGKKNYYCTWACPYGSAQELVGKCSNKKLNMSPKVIKGLKWVQYILWAVLMVLSWSGIFLDWMNYEIFSAFIWESAQWIVIAFAAVFLVLSIFVNRPFCRFVCPVGAMLKKL